MTFRRKGGSVERHVIDVENMWMDRQKYLKKIYGHAINGIRTAFRHHCRIQIYQQQKKISTYLYNVYANIKLN